MPASSLPSAPSKIAQTTFDGEYMSQKRQPKARAASCIRRYLASSGAHATPTAECLVHHSHAVSRARRLPPAGLSTFLLQGAIVVCTTSAYPANKASRQDLPPPERRGYNIDYNIPCAKLLPEKKKVHALHLVLLDPR